jgi:hypothetical protein
MKSTVISSTATWMERMATPWASTGNLLSILRKKREGHLQIKLLLHFTGHYSYKELWLTTVTFQTADVYKQYSYWIYSATSTPDLTSQNKTLCSHHSDLHLQKSALTKAAYFLKHNFRDLH